MRRADRNLRGRFLRTFSMLAVPVVLLSACTASDGPTDATVHPIEEILDSEIILTPDPSGTFATLIAETNTPVVCSVVYGTSDAFGLIATDDDMAGGAHADHGPRLRGLTPNTTYSYRLQGSDANGTLYQSDIFTFTTPQAAAAEFPGENVAPFATVVAVSSIFSEAFAAERAIDGDLTTEWSTAGDGDSASLTIDLGEVTPVIGIVFRSREMTDGTAIIQQYTVTVDDGATIGPLPAGPDGEVSDVSFEGRILRFDATTTTGGNTGAVEIEVYRAPPKSTP